MLLEGSGDDRNKLVIVFSVASGRKRHFTASAASRIRAEGEIVKRAEPFTTRTRRNFIALNK